MSRDTHTREIEGVTYRVTMLGAKDGLRTLARLSKLLGPVALAADGGSVVGGIVEAVRSLDPDEVVTLACAFEGSTKVVQPVQSSGARSIDLPLDMDAHFAGKIGALLSWLSFAIEVNYADFFGEIVSTVTAATSAMRGASKSLNTSAAGGPSSGSPQAGASPTP